jgi:hypothetical protein
VRQPRSAKEAHTNTKHMHYTIFSCKRDWPLVLGPLLAKRQRPRGSKRAAEKIEGRGGPHISPPTFHSNTRMSSIAEIMSLVSALSLNDKLQLNAQLATAMAPSAGKTSEVKTKSSRAGKPASLGIRAWGAFVKHAQETMPERFAPPALPKERLVIAGAIRLENPAAYEAFCAKFKEENPLAEAAPAPEAAEPAVEAATEPAVEPASEEKTSEAATESASESASESESQADAKPSSKPRKPRAKLTDEQKAIMKAKTAATKAKKAAEATA